MKEGEHGKANGGKGGREGKERRRGGVCMAPQLELLDPPAVQNAAAELDLFHVTLALVQLD